jgi:magnesium-transporting ATPase (P-type)
VFPEPPFAGFWALFFESFQDPILLILIAAAVVSFVVGLINHPADGWIDGVAIVIAILLVGDVAQYSCAGPLVALRIALGEGLTPWCDRCGL